MNLKQLEYFVAIAEERQITAAARRLNISQPPLSYELRQLESELGVTLVVRGPRQARLTEAGQLLYQRATKILAMTAAARREVESVGSGMTGTLSLGVCPDCAGLVPAARLRELRDRFPEVSAEVSEGSTSEVLELLEGGIVDVGVVRTPFKSGGLRCRFAAAEPFVAVMPADLEVGSDLSCTLEDLAAVPLALSRRQEPAVSSAFAERGLSPQVACVMDDVRTCVLWAREGMAVALAPRSLIRVTDTGDQFIKVVDCRGLDSRPAVVWRADRLLSPLAERAVALLGELS